MKLIIFELSLDMSLVRTDQITCQMFFFKHYFSFIFLVSVLSFCSCKNLKNEDNDYAKEIEVIRFEKLFFEYDFDSISSLKKKFPYLFPKQFSTNDWMSIYKDTLRRDIFNKSNQVFKNFNPYKKDTSQIYLRRCYTCHGQCTHTKNISCSEFIPWFIDLQ